jgi:hypothetical protein
LEVGDSVGLYVGCRLGADVGCKGDFVGPREGTRDGPVVGKALGRNDVVATVGKTDGFPVGSIGNFMGLFDGDLLGETEGVMDRL